MSEEKSEYQNELEELIKTLPAEIKQAEKELEEAKKKLAENIEYKKLKEEYENAQKRDEELGKKIDKINLKCAERFLDISNSWSTRVSYAKKTYEWSEQTNINWKVMLILKKKLKFSYLRNGDIEDFVESLIKKYKSEKFKELKVMLDERSKVSLEIQGMSMQIDTMEHEVERLARKFTDLEWDLKHAKKNLKESATEKFKRTAKNYQKREKERENLKSEDLIQEVYDEIIRGDSK